MHTVILLLLTKLVLLSNVFVPLKMYKVYHELTFHEICTFMTRFRSALDQSRGNCMNYHLIYSYFRDAYVDTPRGQLKKSTVLIGVETNS